MSKYTIELKRVCELVGRDTVESYFTDYNLSDYLTNEQINVINNGKIKYPLHNKKNSLLIEYKLIPVKKLTNISAKL